ncbi:MAG: hypothetical protein KJ621_15935 [Proteobacteria bacterium]|nr:hypothetical protein [Pseudomonadota bacterium]MBU1740038.1 hypothetical protein [Pseudomonadota bacterium]
MRIRRGKAAGTVLAALWLTAACGPTDIGPPEVDAGPTPAVVDVTYDVDVKFAPGAKRRCFGAGYSFLGQNYLVEARYRRPDGQVRRLPEAGVYQRIVVDDQVREKRSYYAPPGRQRLVFTVKLQKRYSSGMTGKRITFRSCYIVLVRRVVDRTFGASRAVRVRVANTPRPPARPRVRPR